MKFPHSRPLLLTAVVLLLCLIADVAIADEVRQSRTVLQAGHDVFHGADLPSSVQPDIRTDLRLAGYRDDSRQPLGDASESRFYGLDLRYREIWLTSAALDLVIDDDSDAYYQGFRVSLDFSAVGGAVWLYTRTYLSYEGGPWNLLHRSRAFYVSSVDPVNAFEMTTLLDSGYPSGYYDVRIDFYSADSDRWLFSYGPYDESGFSSIPLEDRWRDGVSSDHGATLTGYAVNVSGSGALGFLGLAIFAILLPFRRN